MKYAVVITWSTGEKTGATVISADSAEAWNKVLEHFDFGNKIRSIVLYEILTNDREIT